MSEIDYYLSLIVEMEFLSIKAIGKITRKKWIYLAANFKPVYKKALKINSKIF